MKNLIIYALLLSSVFFGTQAISTVNKLKLNTENTISDVALSSQTEECIACHGFVHQGLMQSWKNSLHAKTTPAIAMQKDDLEKRISAPEVADSLKNVAVGCYECHGLNTANHADAFEHNGYIINLVVSPADCATCHPVENEEFGHNLMANAHSNLMDNALYMDLMKSINNNYEYKKGSFEQHTANDDTNAESCLYCHGTKLEVTGMEARETDLGEMEFPVIEGWPNNGVGRINTDGSKGSCASCHTRHDFSIATARKPYTCSECHKGPDVPAYKVYEASKHGNIFASEKNKMNFDNVPWVIGNDFTVPTCATCHASLITDAEGTVIAHRTHSFNNRLANRLFGVPYSHPHPVSPEINVMKNSAGLPLATELDGTPVKQFLIDEAEQQKRNNTMKKVCLKCHGSSWVDAHFERLDNTIATTNKNTLSATQLLTDIWNDKYAAGIPQNESIFDEHIERQWTNIWLFYANSVRFSAAMGGGGDYGVFANGRYQQTNTMQYMQNWYEMKKSIKK